MFSINIHRLSRKRRKAKIPATTPLHRRILLTTVPEYLDRSKRKGRDRYVSKIGRY